MTANGTNPSEAFDRISEHDSKSLFKPNVPALVVSNSDEHEPNVMTASWWMLGGYDPFRYVVSISQHERTHEIIQTNPEFVLAAPSTDMVDLFSLAGNVSGRDVDKLEHLDIETISGDSVSVPLLADAIGNVECRVLETFSFEGCTYFIAGVERAYVQPDGLDGRILSTDQNPLAFMGSDWDDEADEHKQRYYLEFDEANLHKHPDAAVLETVAGEKSP